MKNHLKFKKYLFGREFLLVILIIISITIFSSLSDNYLSIRNFDALMLTVSVYGIIGSAMTSLFISGGFDLSAGSVMAMSGVILGVLLTSGVPVSLTILIVIVFGISTGFLMGVIITKLGVSPFVVTLSVMFILKSLAFGVAIFTVVDRSVPVYINFPERFTNIAGGRFLGIEYIVFYLIGTFVIFSFLLSKNIFFRQNYYIGGNEVVSKLLGMKVSIIKIVNYSIVSGTVAFAAVLKASRVQGSTPLTGEFLGLEIAAGVFLGGAILGGGSGSVIGTFLGITLMALLFNGIVILGMNPHLNSLIIGIILLITVLIDRYKEKFQKNI